jgi:hypothetical protein
MSEPTISILVHHLVALMNCCSPAIIPLLGVNSVDGRWSNWRLSGFWSAHVLELCVMMLLTALVSSSDHRLVDLDVNNGYDDDKDEDTSDHDGADGGWMECHVESTCLEYENIGREMRRSDELWRTYDTVVIARLGR